MVLQRIEDVLFSVLNLFPASNSSGPFLASGTSPQTGVTNGIDYASSGQKKNMRLSSSLQDLSAYRRIDPENGDHHFGTDSSVARTKQTHPLQRENVLSSFSKERPLPILRRKWVRVIVVLLLLMVLAIIIYMFVNFFYTAWARQTYKYFVVLDCGSTGTRVHIYQASIDRKRGGFPLVLKSFPEGFHRNTKAGRAYSRMETEPGLDKLVHNTSALKVAIKPLLRWAEKQIPSYAHRTTSLFLCATAGVRRLPSSDSSWLLKKAWSILKNSPFSCRKEWVKVISGTEEAYYGWIALNYYSGTLGSVPKKSTYGALDLGGSSLQVTFESDENGANESGITLSIGFVKHRLIAYSLAGYGLNDAFDRSVVHLFTRHIDSTKSEKIRGNVELKHPCLQAGYKEQYSCSQCASVYPKNTSQLAGRRSLREDRRAGVHVTLVGAPKWDECSALARVVVNFSRRSDINPRVDCDIQPCARLATWPRPYGEFYAMSGFFVVYRFFNLSSEATLDDVLEKGREFCEKKWEVAKNSVVPQPFVEQYCFRGPYIVSLLREGLHITDGHVTVGSGSITWTFGVALLEAGKILPTSMKLRGYELLQVKINPVVLFTVILVSFVLLVCALSCLRLPRIFKTSYLPLFKNNATSTSSVLRPQRWSPMSSGDVRVKMPLSPTVTSGSETTPFGVGTNSFANIELSESSLFKNGSGVAHSFSSGSLGHVKFDMSPFWSSHRSKTRLQSRRSQSREELNSSISDAHLMKA